MLLDNSLFELSNLIREKKVSPVEITEESLRTIELVDPKINAYVTIAGEFALDQAKRAERAIMEGGYCGPLHGIPYAAKDLYSTAGILTTNSSRVHANHIPTEDAVTIKRLRDAGMILIGKTETHEFAYGALTLQSGNPWKPNYTTGGSSGGSAAAVAAGTVHVALGTDTGGSIRVPAALCGTVGLKPTFGAVPRTGITPLSWSLDHAGPLTRNVMDSALLFNVLKGRHVSDPSSVESPGLDIENDSSDQAVGLVAGLRVGVPTNFFNERVDPEVSDAFERTLDTLRDLGVKVREVHIPYAESASFMENVHKTIFIAEMAAYHSPFMREKSQLYSSEVRAANCAGECILAKDYINAHRWRTKIQTAWAAMFENIDVMVAPTVAGPSLPRSDPEFDWGDGNKESGSEGYLRLTRPANLVGLPALQVPNGYTESGLPTGVQILGKPFDESRVLAAGLALEKVTDFVGRVADIP